MVSGALVSLDIGKSICHSDEVLAVTHSTAVALAVAWIPVAILLMVLTDRYEKKRRMDRKRRG